MSQGIYEQIGTLPAIEPELHLFQVGAEMFGADSVPCSHDAALKQRKGGFDGVGMNVSHDVHAGTVVNLFVVRPFGFPHGRFVCGSIIGENDFHILTDILADVLRERSAFGVPGMEEAKIAVALADADHYFFVVVLCDVALAAHLTADIGHVHLDLAIQHRLIGLRHSVPDAMAEVPRRLVAHSDRALNLAGRHPLLRFAEQVCGEKPLSQCQVGIVKYRAGSDGELIVAILAVEQVPGASSFAQRKVGSSLPPASSPLRSFVAPGELYACVFFVLRKTCSNDAFIFEKYYKRT